MNLSAASGLWAFLSSCVKVLVQGQKHKPGTQRTWVSIPNTDTPTAIIVSRDKCGLECIAAAYETRQVTQELRLSRK